MSLKTVDLYVFGPYRLDPGERLLLCEGQPVGLPPKAFDLLVALVRRAGHLLTKDELLQEVWAGTFVEEGNLSYTISVVRKALGDDSERYIETVPKRGYRFREPVVNAAAATVPVIGTDDVDGTADRAHTAKLVTWIVGAALIASAAGVWWSGAFRTDDELAANDATPELRRLTANPPELPVTSAALSPDGR